MSLRNHINVTTSGESTYMESSAASGVARVTHDDSSREIFRHRAVGFLWREDADGEVVDGRRVDQEIAGRHRKHLTEAKNITSADGV